MGITSKQLVVCTGGVISSHVAKCECEVEKSEKESPQDRVNSGSKSVILSVIQFTVPFLTEASLGWMGIGVEMGSDLAHEQWKKPL